jgi:hypothetical protein
MNPPLVMEPTTHTLLGTIYVHRVWRNYRIFCYPAGDHA